VVAVESEDEPEQQQQIIQFEGDEEEKPQVVRKSAAFRPDIKSRADEIIDVYP
jgi:hypothetical protein